MEILYSQNTSIYMFNKFILYLYGSNSTILRKLINKAPMYLILLLSEQVFIKYINTLKNIKTKLAYGLKNFKDFATL